MSYGAFHDEFKVEIGKLAIEINGKITDGKGEYSYPNCIGKFNEKTIDIEMFWEVGATFLKIYLCSDFLLNLTVEKETIVSRVVEKLGMDTEPTLDRTTVPESFNAQYQITGKPEQKIKEFLSKREVIKEIKLLEPFTRLTIKNTLIFSKHFVNSKDDFKAARMMQIIRSLQTLSKLS